MKRLILLFALTLTACGSKSPSSPSPTPTPQTTATRIIALSGAMNFGNIQVGQTFTATLNVRNNGNSPMAYTGLSGTNGITSVIKVSPTSGTIQPNASQDIAIAFTPTAATTYSGTITVNADQTSGTNSIAFSGTGSLNGLPLFTKSGQGNTVFDMPTYVSRVKIRGVWNGSNTSNFIVSVGGHLVVNEILRNMPGLTYEGTHLVTGGVTEIESSSGIGWTFTEVR